MSTQQPHPHNSARSSAIDRGWTRRTFLAATGAAVTHPVWTTAVGADETRPLIRDISQETLWSNLDGKSVSWFHPRACMMPVPGDGSQALMTLQTIGGSDYFGPVHWSTAGADGREWTEPQPIPAFDRRPVPGHDGLEAGVCDVVPQYHPQTGTVLAMGHVVFYRGPRFSRSDQLPRYPLYAVRHRDGTWSDRNKLEWDDPRGAFIYTNNCGQRVLLPNGDLLLAFSFGANSEARSVAGVRCTFDGRKLTVAEVGPAITHAAGRGLLEPSMTAFDRRYYLTIRAEDNHGYVSVSDDGLNWAPKRAWTWDDGSPVRMSTTQQHWLTHSDGLFLVYTREHQSNRKVIRWRSPLFVAQVDPQTLTLIKGTEQVVHPLVGDGINSPDGVPLMGNFHVTNATANESWVTVGSWLPRQAARGATLLARIRWNRRNRLVV